MNTATETVLRKALTPVFQSMTPDIARRIAELRADDELQKKVASYAERANEGDLTPDDRRDYESCVQACDVLASLQALARQVLRNADSQ